MPNATLTRVIQSLEHDLKIRLLHRTTRSVTVTPEGATYYERVVRLLAELADILARGNIGAVLEIRYTVTPYRGFESLLLRQMARR